MAVESGVSNGGAGEEKLPYPRGAIFMLIGYTLERLVFSGLSGAAVFYMQRTLEFSSASASTIKAILDGTVYIAPIPGAILADTYVGKVRMVFTMSCTIVVGTIVYSLSSVTPMMPSVIMARVTGIGGLLIMSLCTGLMKAAYISLGADQFKLPEQREQQMSFFSNFIWVITIGAFVGSIVTAQLRDTVQCFGDDCYFLPFSIMVGCMVLSIVSFALGRSHYISSPPDKTLIQSIHCIAHAVRKSWEKDHKPVEHWLDRARDKFDEQIVHDVRVTIRVLILFLNFPFIWALFYHMGTGMIFQSKRLNARMGSYVVPPELVPALSTICTLVLIPLFQVVVYPALARLGLLTKISSRMIAGMFCAVIAFIMYALVSMSVEQHIIPATEARIHVYNTLPCQLTVSLPNVQVNQVTVEEGGEILLPSFIIEVAEEVEVQMTAPPNCSAPNMSRVKMVVLGGHETTLIASSIGAEVLNPTLEYLKDEDAEVKVRVVDLTRSISNITLKYFTLEEDFAIRDGKSEFQRLSPREYKVMLEGQELGDAFVYQDGVYDVVLVEGGLFLFPMTGPEDVHFFWVLPQCIFITLADIGFDISCMDFAYTESPMSMKSTLQAANLFTITLGVWLFAGLTSLREVTGAFRHRPSHEILLYAAIMFVNTIIFILSLKWYNGGPRFQGGEPKELATTTVEKAKKTPLEPCSCHDNSGFVDEHTI